MSDREVSAMAELPTLWRQRTPGGATVVNCAEPRADHRDRSAAPPLLARLSDPDATRAGITLRPNSAGPVRARLLDVAKAQHAKPKVNPACHSAPKAE
jgi:hypothetical protein